MPINNIEIRHLGLLPYHEALTIMEQLHAEVVGNKIHPGYLLTVEHPNVVTMGNRDTTGDMLATTEALKKLGIDFAKIDRGGSVTVHEPGQIVLYPLLRLDTTKLTVKRYVWLLEECMIRFCAQWEVLAARDSQHPGVWVGQNKIGALGIRIKDFVSKHGLAFNYTNSLKTFEVITPCGIRNRGVTTLERERERAMQYSTTATPPNLPHFSVASEQMSRLFIDLLNDFYR